MNRKIFISGASKGIGLAIARKFYQENFEVIICARGKESLEAAKSEMPNLHTFVCDMSDKDAVKALGKTLNDQFGRLDILINNAGVFMPGQIHSEEDSTYETMMRTNIDSAYYMTKALLPAMLEEKKGTIVNMSSVAGIKPYEYGGSYGISKYAMLGFSKNLREELKPHNIRVISLMPGATLTPSWDGFDAPEERFIPAEDIAAIVWNACSLSERTVIEDIVVRPALGDL
ncbi:MAG: SDR family oxidoreductase [Bacteroidota bacterium]